MITETIEAPAAPSQTAIEPPKETQMAKSIVDKFFAPEPAKEEVKSEPVVTEKKVEPTVEKKVEVVPKIEAKPAPVVDKSKSRTALEFDNQRAEYEAKVKSAETQRDEIKAQIVDMQTELSDLREKASSAADYAEIKQKNKELSDAISRLNVQEHPEFKAKYNAQEEYLFKQVGDVLEGVEQKDKIIAALKLPPGAQKDATLDELQQDLGITKIAKLANYVARLEEISKNKAFEISNAQIANRLYQEEQENKAVQEKKSHEQIFEKFAQNAIEIDPTYKKVEGQDDYNRSVDNHLSEAKRMYSENQPEIRAKAMLAYARQPILMKLIETLSNELNTATGALNGKLQATPGISASRKDEPTKPTSFLETIKQSLTS